jgi:transcriptional regulator with XRE-family HTH domain
VKAKFSTPDIMRRASKLLAAPGSKVALAKELGVPRSRISDWLMGRRVPDGNTMLALLNWVLERERETK